MAHDRQAPRQTWQITLDGSPEHVDLVPYSGRLWGAPERFAVGSVERKLERAAGLPWRERVRAPQTGSIDVHGHRVEVTLTRISPSYRSAVRRNLSNVKRSGPLALLGTILGGAALGGGAAAASQTTLIWLIYELSIDGDPAGSWVARTVDGLPERWTFVQPGGSLPDRDSPGW